jgi:peptidyl-tRNA hydrolase, PTH2 family
MDEPALAERMGITEQDLIEPEVKQVIVIRRDLGMRRGKEIAQGAHAAMKWLAVRLRDHFIMNGDIDLMFTPAQEAWIIGTFRKIVCQVETEAELHLLKSAADAAGVEAHIITDAGATEFGGVPTITAIAIGPDYDDTINEITSHLKLY